MYRSDAIEVTIRRESDNSLITELVNVRFTDENSTITNFQTSNGTLYLTGFTHTTYNLLFTSANFTSRSFSATFGSVYQNLTALLLASEGFERTIFTFQDRDDGSIVSGLVLTVQKLVNTTWQTVEVLTSDITGRTAFDYEPNTAYRFITSRSGYLVKDFLLDPILFSSYIIRMDKDSSASDDADFSGLVILYNPKQFFNNQNHTVSFLFSDPNSRLINYGFTAEFNGTVVGNSGSNPLGSGVSATLEVLGARLGDVVTLTFYYDLDSGVNKTFVRTYLIINPDTDGSFLSSLGEHYGLGLIERIIIVTVIVLLVAGLGSYYAGGVVGGLLGAFLFGLFAFVGFIPLWSVIISIVMLFIILTWRSTQ
jgi:hypothetical protein